MDAPTKKHHLLANVAATWPENSFHDHAEIAAIIEVKPTDKSYYSVITQARKLLLRQRVLWVSIQGAGYRVATPDEFTAAVRGSIVGAARQMRKAVNIDIAAPTERMTEEGKKAHINLSDRLRVHAAMMSGVVKEIRQLADPKIKLTR
jgi:hypothetical protein